MSSTGAWDNMINDYAAKGASTAAGTRLVRAHMLAYSNAYRWAYRLLRALLQRSVNPAGVMAQFHLLALNEPHRVAKLLMSLDAGRYGDVLRALHDYRAPVTGGTLDGSVDEGAYGDVPYGGSGTDDPEDAKFEAEHYGR